MLTGPGRRVSKRLMTGPALLCVATLCLGDSIESGELGDKEQELHQLRERIERLHSDLVSSEERHRELMAELEARRSTMPPPYDHPRVAR